MPGVPFLNPPVLTLPGGSLVVLHSADLCCYWYQTIKCPTEIDLPQYCSTQANTVPISLNRFKDIQWRMW